MKKFLALAILLLSAAAFVPSVEAKSNNSAANNVVEPQIRVRLGRQNRRFNRRVRVVTQVRNVRRGRALFRETYRTTYLPNGRVQTRLISSIRIR